MIDENEKRHRCNETEKIFQEDGWRYLEADWILEREKIIAKGSKAAEEGNTNAAAFLMAELGGFDRALRVPQAFRIEFQRFIEDDAQKKDKKEFTNA